MVPVIHSDLVVAIRSGCVAPVDGGGSCCMGLV